MAMPMGNLSCCFTTTMQILTTYMGKMGDEFSGSVLFTIPSFTFPSSPLLLPSFLSFCWQAPLWWSWLRSDGGHVTMRRVSHSVPRAPHTHVFATQAKKSSTPLSDYLGKIWISDDARFPGKFWSELGKWLPHGDVKTTVEEKCASVCVIEQITWFGKRSINFDVKIVTSHWDGE